MRPIHLPAATIPVPTISIPLRRSRPVIHPIVKAALVLGLVAGASPLVAQQTPPAQQPPAQQPPAQGSSQQQAQKIVVGGEVRLRSEYDDRHVLNERQVMVHLLRSRLRATAHPLAWITVLG